MLPFLNMCEKVGSCLKASLKQTVTELNIEREIYDRDIPREQTLQRRRMHILQREVAACIETITPAKSAQCMRHVMSYMGACMRGEDTFRIISAIKL